MSLLKYLAIDALELSAPATSILLQQEQENRIQINSGGWLQLAGHPESITPSAVGVVSKRLSSADDSEVAAYQGMSNDLYASKLIPRYLGVTKTATGESYLELQDLLHGFNDPNVMDIKMGRRTFLETEVNNTQIRGDLYKKMCSVDPSAPTDEEHKQKAITKLRYMQFREEMSSSQTKGFRIEALKLQGRPPITDLKRIKSENDIVETIQHFLNCNSTITGRLIKRLKEMRSLIEKSDYFKTHEVVGSSVFVVYDNQNVGAWLIDFAKARPLPDGIKVNHRSEWRPGNCEEGILHGMDELIKVCEKVEKM